MRVNDIICDMCRAHAKSKEVSVYEELMVPPAWFTVHYGKLGDEARHFCSADCLRTWSLLVEAGQLEVKP